MARWRAPCSDFEPADRTGFSRQHHIGEQCGAKKVSCRGKPWSGFPARLLHVLQECYFWLWMGATWRATPKVDFWTTENAHMDTSLVACWGRLRSSLQMLWASAQTTRLKATDQSLAHFYLFMFPEHIFISWDGAVWGRSSLFHFYSWHFTQLSSPSKNSPKVHISNRLALHPSSFHPPLSSLVIGGQRILQIYGQHAMMKLKSTTTIATIHKTLVPLKSGHCSFAD